MMPFPIRCLFILILICLLEWTVFWILIGSSFSVEPERKTSDNQCQRKLSVVFLKTHKTGSSTIANILNRYVHYNNLHVALPINQDTRLGWPNIFQRKYVDATRLPQMKANALINHAVFNEMEMKRVVFPKPLLITILRKPEKRFESQFFYSNFHKIFKLQNESNPLLSFLERPMHYLSKKKNTSSSADPDETSLLLNGMMFDFTGQSWHVNHTSSASMRSQMKIIRRILKKFSLTMITEYFDESLILLKNILCLNFIDILYIKQLVRKRVQTHLLSKDVKGRLYYLSKADFLLYKQANKSLWDRISSYGEEFYKELEFFRKINSVTTASCQQNKSCKSAKEWERIFFREGLSLSRNFVLNSIPPCFCKDATRSEREYIEFFREKYPSYYFYQKGSKRT